MADTVDKIYKAICAWKCTHYKGEPRFIYIGGDLLNEIKRDVYGNISIAKFASKSPGEKPGLYLWEIPVRVVVDDPEHLEVL